MKYIHSVVISLFFLAGVVHANDSAPNTLFWMKNDAVVTCMSFNLDALPINYFLVFDYSSAEGGYRGKPWTIIEPGKCYSVDNDSRIFSIESSSSGLERSVFEHTSQYPGSANVRDIFCAHSAEAPTHDTSCRHDELRIEEVPLPFMETPGVTMLDTLYSIGVYADAVFPMKYELGIGTIFYAAVSPQATPFINDPKFQEVKKRYEMLAQELNNALLACDTRQRAEYRVTPKYYSYSSDIFGVSLSEETPRLIWRMGDGVDIEVPQANDMYDGYKRMQFMGCTDMYKTYVSMHRDEFTELDSLIYALIRKYPTDEPSLAVGRERTQRAQEMLRAFINDGALPPHVDEKETDTPNRASEENDGKTYAYFVPLSEEEVARSDREPTTIAEKVSAVRQTKSSSFLGYTLLPLIGLLLIAGIYFRTKHSKY